jgi:hypothetical protein
LALPVYDQENRLFLDRSINFDTAEYTRLFGDIEHNNLSTIFTISDIISEMNSGSQNLVIDNSLSNVEIYESFTFRLSSW